MIAKVLPALTMDISRPAGGVSSGRMINRVHPDLS